MAFQVAVHLIMLLGVFASVAHSRCTGTRNFTCGDWKILTYPFWTNTSQQLTSCSGEFELSNCDTDPELYNQCQRLRVIDISQEKKTMRLSLHIDYPCVLPSDANMGQHSSSIFLSHDCHHGKDHHEFPKFPKVPCKSGKHERVYWGINQIPPHIKNSFKHHFNLMNGTTLDDIRSSTTMKNLQDKLLAAVLSGIEVSIVSISSSPRPQRGGLNIKLVLVIVFCASGGTVMIMSVIFVIYRRHRKAKYARSSDPSSVTDPEKMGALYGVKFFMYEELKEATENFSESREIGDGAFGTVYLGTLQDGRNVAVKRLYENSYKIVERFLNEVDILAHLRHQNLVTLYGCTSRHSRELLLVYEYISNGTVADHLHGEYARSGSLSWLTRLKIAVETASALTYLHASDIIHRDVKTNNILLDDYFNVKVADFGLSRLFPLNLTHVSTAPQGTPGYVDPEYRQCYQLTDKSDVYSFGVVLVELISSKRAVDITRPRSEINLSNMAILKIQNGALHELVDPSLGFDENTDVHRMITAVAELAFRCLQSDQDSRPSMQEVLDTLTRIQCGDSQTGDKAEELDIFSDEFVLLKNSPTPLSPESKAVK